MRRDNFSTGTDPSFSRKQKKRSSAAEQGNSFATVAREWWLHQKGTWTEDHANRVWTRLNDNTASALGGRPIVGIGPQDIIPVIREIENRDALDVSQRVLQDIRRVCRYTVQTGRLTVNPAADLTGVLRARKSAHRASLPREELPAFLAALATYDTHGRLMTKLAIELLILTFVRPGELRGARWAEFSLQERLWRIPGERMKMKTDHLVPLSRQAQAVIE